MATPQSGRFGQFARRAYSLKEGFSPDLVEQIQPVHEISNVVDPTNFRLRGEHLWGASGISPAIVGFPSSILLQTPLGTICAVNKIFVSGTGSIQVNAFWSTVSLATVNPVSAADGRTIGIPKREAPSFDQTISIAQQSGLQTPFAQFVNAVDYGQLNIVVPGDPFSTPSGGPFFNHLLLQGSSVNAQIVWFMMGWIRANEPSETF